MFPVLGRQCTGVTLNTMLSPRMEREGSESVHGSTAATKGEEMNSLMVELIKHNTFI